MTGITGSTRIFPVLGWPVEQVKAPALFNAYFRRHGLDARVVPLKIAPAHFCQAVHALMQAENVGAILVAIPHKPMGLQAVAQASLRARIAGACNAVYRRADGAIAGDLIDGEGFVRALQRSCAGQPFDWARSRALVLGCGGAGCAIAAALAAQAIAEIALYDTRRSVAQALQARVQQAFAQTRVCLAEPVAAGYQLVVNCTPLGMHDGDRLPVALDGVGRDCIVADCGMKIEMSQLLRQAQERGCRIQTGKEMLIEQAPLYLELFGWPGVSASDFRALEAL